MMVAFGERVLSSKGDDHVPAEAGHQEPGHYCSR